ncbi:hypothetical protein ACIBG7_23270 [Nonomuraea sp. NPDC050328]|uniref:hypothetical protein n=1 Tax=Nonomuraea sp. NPDC050328 TaxID=3364361 RepID=UPI0037AC9205
MISQLTTRTELYLAHARGLFAYCADQLGDHGSAADAVTAVLSKVVEPPPRAALYALARREIQRRDVVYAPPVVDPLVDPLCSLIERAVRDLRPHQREVLVLCEVCGLDRVELAWVLDVAVDTADELAELAREHFRHALDRAFSSIAVRLVTDEHHAVRMAPLTEILRRLPWPAPPPLAEAAGPLSGTAEPLSGTAEPYLPEEAGESPLNLWPLTPRWPLPLAEIDHLSSTGLFPAELVSPPEGPFAHEAATAPMPKVRDQPSLVLAAPVPVKPFEDVRAKVEEIVDNTRRSLDRRGTPRSEPGDVLVAGERDDASGRLFLPRPQPPEPVYIMPPEPETAEIPEVPEIPEIPEVAETPRIAESPETPQTSTPEPVAAAPEAVRVVPRSHRPIPRKRRDRHHDWAWELAGFLACVAIAMAVFFSLPS